MTQHFKNKRSVQNCAQNAGSNVLKARILVLNSKILMTSFLCYVT